MPIKSADSRRVDTDSPRPLYSARGGTVTMRLPSSRHASLASAFATRHLFNPDFHACPRALQVCTYSPLSLTSPPCPPRCSAAHARHYFPLIRCRVLRNSGLNTIHTQTILGRLRYCIKSYVFLPFLLSLACLRSRHLRPSPRASAKPVFESGWKGRLLQAPAGGGDLRHSPSDGRANLRKALSARSGDFPVS